MQDSHGFFAHDGDAELIKHRKLFRVSFHSHRFDAVSRKSNLRRVIKISHLIKPVQIHDIERMEKNPSMRSLFAFIGD